MNPTYTVALVGNPNCGKTTLFNALTGARQRVGNWPGVTVEKKSGAFHHGGLDYELIDLPGTYSLHVGADDTSLDEQIAQKFIFSGNADVVLNIVDASSLERNLYLTTQLLDASLPMVVALNIVNIGAGEPVDPEDWAPERSQDVEPLMPGETAVQHWTINAILEGDYMIYLTVIPMPRGAGGTSQPVSSPGIHLVVSLYSPLNPGGVLPVALGLPVGLLAIFGWQKVQLQKRKEG